MLLEVLSVFGFGMIGLWEGIPVGFLLRLPPFVVGSVSAAGSMVATVLVLLLGKRIQARLLRRRAERSSTEREQLIDRVWRRYGLVGFGLLAPGLTGAPIGVALGLFFRAPVRGLLFWMILGIVLWTLILTVAGAYGSVGIRTFITG